jgi:hypothetical protein
MHFLKEHLQGLGYHWQVAGEQLQEYSRHPSRRLFDRFNGHQVLYMINFFCTLTGELTIEKGQKIEWLLSTILPVEIKSEISVFNWLNEKYLYS